MVVHCGLRIFRFLAFDLRCGVWIFLFGFRFLFDSSGHHALPLISKSRETCVGSFRVLRTGMWTFISFDGFACGFWFWSHFFCVCMVLQTFLFVLFCVLNYSRTQLFLLKLCMEFFIFFIFIFIFLIFLDIKCSCLSHFTLVFGTESEGMGIVCARQLIPALVCIIVY